MNDETPLENAARVFEMMRHLVLEQDDRRRDVAEATGMSFIRTKALRRLARAPMRMSELAALTATDKPYATLVVDDLERRGLVVRSVAPDDRRGKVVTITPEGRAVAARAEAILAQPASGLLRLDPDELATLNRLLAKALDDGPNPG